MKRKNFCFILLLLLLIFNTACQRPVGSNATGEVLKPDSKGMPELNIIMMPGMENWEKQGYFADYKKDFEQKFGVKINYIRIKSLEEGSKELMTKLSVPDGPELVLDAYDTVRRMIDAGAAVDLSGKVSNLDKLYSSLRAKEVYYVPFGINAFSMILRKEMLDELHVSIPGLSWTQEDYYSIYDKWTSESKRIFTREEFYNILNRVLDEEQIFDYENKKVHVNTAYMKSALNNISEEIHSGKYKLKDNYTYKNYYNMLGEPTSEEYKTDFSLSRTDVYADQNFESKKDDGNFNMLLPKDTDLAAANKLIIRPPYSEEKIILWSLGFLVNKNGANKELAYEFINGLLSDEVQMNIIAPVDENNEHIKLYPVNGEIEEKISEHEKQKGYSDEAIQLKQFVLQKLKNGECEIMALQDYKKGEYYFMLRKDLLPFIFSDRKYSDVELSKELQKVEDKYNIFLSE